MRLGVAVLLAGLVGSVFGGCRSSGAEPDDDYPVQVARPAYPDHGPRVLFDEGHANLHRANRTYRPFVELIRNDGYQVDVTDDAFSARSLAGRDILVISNALGSNERNDDPAFTEVECAAVEQWVRAGGSLLLITDHYPFGHAAQRLADRFGVHMSKGVTEDPTSYDGAWDPSHIVYSRENGGLPDHPITSGVTRVVTFTGQSLSVPPGAVAFLLLGPSSVDRAPAPRVERSGGDVRVHVEYGDSTGAHGRAQGIALAVGDGRVVVLGEAAMLSAQRSQFDGSPFGMNVTGYDNRQLALNIMHWLSRHED